MSNFTFRFGTLKSSKIGESASGTEYAKFEIQAPTFVAYCVTFDADLIKTIAETEDGEKIRAGGFIDQKKVTTDDGEKTYITLITRSLKIADGETVSAKKADNAETPRQEAADAKSDAASAPTPESNDVAEEIVADDLTKIKGIGKKSAQALNDLGFFTYAQLAAANGDERLILDQDVPPVKGAFTRSDVFGQAEKLAA